VLIATSVPTHRSKPGAGRGRGFGGHISYHPSLSCSRAVNEEITLITALGDRNHHFEFFAQTKVTAGDEDVVILTKRESGGRTVDAKKRKKRADLGRPRYEIRLSAAVDGRLRSE
jgi:hypothetical protein